MSNIHVTITTGIVLTGRNLGCDTRDLSATLLCNRALRMNWTYARGRREAGMFRGLKAAHLASRLCIVVGRLACSKLSATAGEPEAQEVSSLMRP